MTTIKLGLYSADMLEKLLIDNLLVFFKRYPQHQFGVYTVPPGTVLNGGRGNSLVEKDNYIYQASTNNSKVNIGHKVEVAAKFMATVQRLNSEGVTVDFAFNNVWTDQADLEDAILKECLEILEINGLSWMLDNGIIYTNDLVKQVVQADYGDSLKYTASVIKFYDEYPDFTYQQALAENDKIVLMPRDVPNQAVLEAIPVERRGDVYIIINSVCKMECAPEKAIEHYSCISMMNRGLPITDVSKDGCRFTDPKFTPLTISEEQADHLRQMGFAFKVARQYPDSKLGIQDSIDFIFDHPYFLKS